MNQKTRANRVAAMVAALSMLVQPTAHLVAATSQAQPPAKPAAAPPTQPGSKPPLAAVAAATPAPVDGGWPRMYSLPSGGSILVYQPQIASWEKQSHMVAFSAVSYRSKAGDKPALGTVKIEADTKVAARRSAGQLSETEDRRSELPDAAEGAGARDRRRDRQSHSRRRARASRSIASWPTSTRARSCRRTSTGIKADPPTIFFSKTPAVIVEPRWRTDLEPDQGERPASSRSTRTGICSSTCRRIRTTCAITTPG